MKQGVVFESNRGQAVRLPKAVALPDDVRCVEVVAAGRTRILTPAGETWDAWFDEPGTSAEFIIERDQSAGQARGSLDVA